MINDDDTLYVVHDDYITAGDSSTIELYNECPYDNSLGGWLECKDDLLIQRCLSKSLSAIEKDYLNIDIKSHVRNVVCKTESNNGINIQLTFSIDKEQWLCLFYKQLPQSNNIQLQQCQRIKN